MGQGRMIDVRGARLWVLEEGDPDGRPFIWAHGLTSSIDQERLLGAFDWASIGGLRVVRYDARGHGRSSASNHPEDYRWDQLGLDLLGVADSLGLERFVAGGASMGCASAVHAAVTEPGRVEALVLAIPPTAWATRADQGALYQAGADAVEAAGIAPFVDAMVAGALPPVLAERGDEVRQAMAEHLGGLDPATLPAVLRGAAASDLPDPDDIAALGLAAVVLAWADDPGHPLSTAQVLADSLAGGQVHVARHLADLEGWPAVVAGALSPGGG